MAASQDQSSLKFGSEMLVALHLLLERRNLTAVGATPLAEDGTLLALGAGPALTNFGGPLLDGSFAHDNFPPFRIV